MLGCRKWRLYSKKIIRQLRLMPIRIRYGAGTMDKYFNVKKKYEELDAGVQKSTNMSEAKKKILHRRYRDLIREYGRLVTSGSWKKEKAAEEIMLKKAILCEEKKFPDKYRDEVEYCKSHGGFMLYPYPFTEKYRRKQESLPVYKAESKQTMLKYVFHHGRRLYFPDQEDDSIRQQYIQLIMEQDKLSPHKYFNAEKSFGGG